MLDEVVLAREQGVVNRGPGLRSAVEGALEEGETEGSLILTSKRLIYARGNASESIRESVLGISGGLAPGSKSIIYLDADDLNSITPDPANIFIDIQSISSARGIKRIAQSPKLEVEWNDRTRKTEFIQQVTGGSRRKNLNDWAPVIERLKNGTQKIADLPPAPDEGTVEGKVFRVLSDYDERGPLTVELEVEKKFNVELEPDDVLAACEKLVTMGLVKKTVPPGEEAYFERVSPLGEDNLEA